MSIHEPWESLRHAVRRRFQLPTPPTDEELAEIIERVASHWTPDHGPSDEVWRLIVLDVVAPTSFLKQAGLDYADLNALVLQIAAQAKG